jgi:AcrR family transcriptional regulator|tara:strand:- start:226 stop:873 length:648 start_codon:yes stop_codon:yes gene_type:complete
MPTGKYAEMDPARKEKILIRATAQFVENGFEGTSLNALLRDLEMNKSSAYYYFFNKADIYFTAMDRAIALITPSLPPSPNNEVEWRKGLKKLQTVSRITRQSHPQEFQLVQHCKNFDESSRYVSKFRERRTAYYLPRMWMLEHGSRFMKVRSAIPAENLLRFQDAVEELVQSFQNEVSDHPDAQIMKEEYHRLRLSLVRQILNPNQPEFHDRLLV